MTRATDSPERQALPVDLAALVSAATLGGPQWGHEMEDLDFTLLVWKHGEGVAPHVNDEVDVAMIVLDGEGELTVDGQTTSLRAGLAVPIPKGTERAVRATGERLAYLNVHKRRRRLMPLPGGRPPRG